MSPIAIPSAPPPATANVGNGSAPATGDSHFDDALQQAKAKPHPNNGNGSSDDTATTPKQAGHPSKDDADHDQKDDKSASGDPKTPPAPIAALPTAPAVTRQTPATTGKALPVAASPTAAIAASAAKAAPAPAPVPAAAPAQAPVATTAIDKALASHAKPATSAPPTNASVDTASDRDAGATAQSPGLAIDPRSIADSGKDTTPLRLDSNNFTAHLSQLLNGQAAPTANQAPPPAPAQLTMQAPPTQPQFAQETAQHVAWMVGQGIQKAEIQLNPRTLGPIHVDITTHHDHVDVSFAVQHPQTVNALQQTLPQLHDMLAQQGLNLGQASVGQQSSGQQHAAFAQHHSGGGNAGGSGNAEPEAPPAWRPMRIAIPGGVDDFA